MESIFHLESSFHDIYDENIRSKIEKMLQNPREIEEKNEGIWSLMAAHESGYHVYEMKYEEYEKEATKIVTAYSYNYREIANKNFDEPWIEINGEDITFFSKNPAFNLKLDDHIYYKIGRLVDLQNNRINEALLRMFDLINMRDIMEECIAEKPEAILKNEDETIKDIRKWKSLIELSHALDMEISYKWAERTEKNVIEDIIEAQKNGWYKDGYITNNQIKKLMQARNNARDELNSINANGELTDEQWDRAVELEDLIKQYTEQIAKEFENERELRKKQRNSIEDLEQEVQKSSIEDQELPLEEQVEEIIENLEQEDTENPIEEQEFSVEEQIEEPTENWENKSQENSVEKQEFPVEETFKKEISNPKEIFLYARQYTEVPEATPIKKKWKEIIIEKIKELAQKGKDAIENFFNR